MSASSNPYAPPAASSFAEPAPPAPLPEGYARYRLDPPLYRARVEKILRRRAIFGVGAIALYALLIYAIGSFDVFGITFLVLAIAWTAFFLWRGRARTYKLEGRVFASFEILASPRALRRTSLFAPAEILLPEVTSIVEIDGGLSLASENPPRRFFVTSAVAGYAELRARLAAAHPITRAKGVAAFLRTLGHMGREKIRDAAYGTALADPTLHEELAILRAAAISVPSAQIIRPRRLLFRALALWAFLIVMLVAIWQLLAPGP
jgi:hypothetical protein